MERALRDDAASATATDLARSLPVLHGNQGLEEALDEVVRHGGTGLPVQRNGTATLSGWLTHRDILRAVTTARAT